MSAGEIAIQPPLPLGEPVERLTPHAGGWWNPEEPGTGYFVEFPRMTGTPGAVTGFATIYTYNADGTANWLMVQGLVQFASEAERLQDGIIARFSSPILKAANGAPFGGSHRPAEVTVAGLGQGEFVFFTRHTGEFRGGGRTVPLRASSTDAPQTAAEYVTLLSGTWKLQGRLRFPSEGAGTVGPGFERAVSHVIRVEPLGIQPSWTAAQRAQVVLQPDSLRKFWRPPADPPRVLTFAVTCESDCPPQQHPLGGFGNFYTATWGARIWVDIDTGRAGYVTGAQPFGSDPATAYWATNESHAPDPGALNFLFDLFLDTDTLIGRGGVLTTYTYYPQKFEPNSEIVMTKINAKTGPRGTKIY